MMNALAELSDTEVVVRLRQLVARERRITVAVIEHLAEVEARKLYLPAACQSMHAYCVEVLGFSDQAAYKRIRVARAGRRFPQVMRAMAQGALHMSGAVALAPHLTDDNVEEVLQEARGKRLVEIEVLVARLAPRPDVATRIDQVAVQEEWPASRGLSARRVQQRARVVPLAPERFALQVTISGAVREKLARAQDLLRHQNPGGSVEQVIEKALDALIEKVEARKLGATSRPRRARKTGTREYVPRAVRREVVARDGRRCSFVGEGGRRCQATGFLEMDHITPVARGGDGASAAGVRFLCRAHNQYEAERVLGAEAVARGRVRSAMERDVLGALRSLDVSAADARHAVGRSRGETLEERLRSAFAVLRTIYQRRGRVSRCEESGPRDGWVSAGGAP